MFPDASEMSAVTLEKREKRDDDRQNRIPVRRRTPAERKTGHTPRAGLGVGDGEVLPTVGGDDTGIGPKGGGKTDDKVGVAGERKK